MDSPGNAAAKAARYFADVLRCSSTAPVLGIPISAGFRIGPLACSSTLGSRPSQNCATCPAALYTVFELREPSCPLWPKLTRRPSAPVSYTHLRAHETRHDL